MADDNGPWQEFSAPSGSSGPWDDFKEKKPDAPMSLGETAADVGKSAGIGLLKGGLGFAGISGDVREMNANAISKALGYFGHQVDPDTVSKVMKYAVPMMYGPTSSELTKQTENVTGPLYQPKTVPGEYAQTAGELAPAVIGGPEGMATKIATRVLAPTLVGQTAAEIPGVKGTAAEPYAKTIGALTGGIGAMGAAHALTNAVSPMTNVSADLSRALVRDNDTPATIVKRLADARIERPDATLADVGRDNVRGLTERIAQTPGAGRTTIIPALASRQQQQAARLSNDLATLTGQRQSAFQATQEAIGARAKDAAPLYQQAHQDGDFAIWSPELERLSSSPTVQRAMQGAVRVWRDNAIADGYGAMNPGAMVDRGGQLGFLSGKVPVFPNLQFWDYTKRILDDQISAAIRSGQNQKVKTLTTLNKSLRGELDQAVPSYAAARNAWGGPSQYLDAIEEGRGILSNKVSAEELASRLSDMTEAQREGYRIGAVSVIKGKMGSDPSKLGDMTKYIRSPEVRNKIAAMMPTPEAAESFTNSLNYEVGSSELTGRSLGNSATARRLAEKQDADGIVGDLAMGALAHGPTLGLLRRTLGTLPTTIRDSLRSRSDAILADLLVNPQQAGSLRPVMQGVSRVPNQGSSIAAPATTYLTGPRQADGGRIDQFAEGGTMKGLFSTHPVVRKFKAKKARDGQWYAKDPTRPGQYMRVELA